MPEYDLIIVALREDARTILNNYHIIRSNLKFRNIIFIGDKDLEIDIQSAGIQAEVIQESDLVLYDNVKREIESLEPAAVKRTGWYYQQFLKISYSLFCKDEYYLIWDADTVPVRKTEMFNMQDGPFFDVKEEHHIPYFKTIQNLFPNIRVVNDKSFISEHMLVNTQIMKTLIAKIESTADNRPYWKNILNMIEKEDLPKSGFSEYETYGTFVSNFFPNFYEQRLWKSTRNIGRIIADQTLRYRDILWLKKDYDAVSFEKFIEYDERKAKQTGCFFTRLVHTPKQFLE